MLSELADAGLCNTQAARAFELEGLRHDGYREDAEFLRHPRDHRCGARSGAAAHARSDEHHVTAGNRRADVLDGLFRGGLADLGLGAGTQPFRQTRPELDALFRAGGFQRLGVGVGHHELGAREPSRNHIVDGVSAGPTHADDGYARSHVPEPFKSSREATVPFAASNRLPPVRPAPTAFPRWGRGRPGRGRRQ